MATDPKVEEETETDQELRPVFASLPFTATAFTKEFSVVDALIENHHLTLEYPKGMVFPSPTPPRG